jgi:hypothetical protein
MRIQAAIASIAIAIVCVVPQRSMAVTYDLVASFNDTGTQPQAGNPFTYGTTQTLNGAFTLFPFFGTETCTFGSCATNGFVQNYYSGTNFVGPTTGRSIVTSGGDTLFVGNIVIPNTVLFVEPAIAFLNVTKFTVPTTGVYNITGAFSDLQRATVGLKILVNGSTRFSASYTTQDLHKPEIPFNLIIFLTQGMSLDFVIDSLGEYSNDVVGLRALISNDPIAPPAAVPLPAALPLFATGLGALGLIGWRRKRKLDAAH